jgi:hypothetical protein
MGMWVGIHKENLLKYTVDELVQMYPGKDRNYLQTIKRYHKRKATMKNPENTPESVSDNGIERRLHSTWTTPAFDREKGEWVPYTNEKYVYEHDPAEVFEQAVAARITPTKRVPPKRDHKLLFVYGDAQIDYRRLEDGTLDPIHDETVINIAHMLCKDLKPDEIINVGDTVDLAGLSRFAPDSDHFHRTIGPSFQRVHDMYAQFRSDSPWAKITEVDSNHNTRLKKFMLNNAPALYGMKRPGEDDYPVMTYPYLANLKPLDINWISGYGGAEYLYGEKYGVPPIIFKHGVSATKAGVARKESADNPYAHVVRGHSHRAESHYRTMRNGTVLGSFVVGVACKTTGEVPSYHSSVDDNNQVVPHQEDWQNGFMLIEDYGGVYNFQHLIAQDGKINYRGREYDGKES